MATKVKLVFAMGIIRRATLTFDGKLFISTKGPKHWPFPSCQIYNDAADETYIGEGYDGYQKGSTAYRNAFLVRRAA